MHTFQVSGNMVHASGNRDVKTGLWRNLSRKSAVMNVRNDFKLVYIELQYVMVLGKC